MRRFRGNKAYALLLAAILIVTGGVVWWQHMLSPQEAEVQVIDTHFSQVSVPLPAEIRVVNPNSSIPSVSSEPAFVFVDQIIDLRGTQVGVYASGAIIDLLVSDAAYQDVLKEVALPPNWQGDRLYLSEKAAHSIIDIRLPEVNPVFSNDEMVVDVLISLRPIGADAPDSLRNLTWVTTP